jgi:CheY-like chemotaxis protein
MKILVVDDQTSILENTLGIVRKAGHEILNADVINSNWMDILKQVQTCDVVLLDLLMDANMLFDEAVCHEHTGIELLRRIRKAECGVPIVILTHLTVGGTERRELQQLGVRRVLSKTTRKNLVELADILVQVVRESKGETHGR